MAVAEAFTLPAQPTTGRAALFPLGGDGVQSPISAYAVESELASDASGGLSVTTITLDQRYASLVQVLSSEIESAAAAVVVSHRLINDEFDQYLENQTQQFEGVGLLATTVVRPPGMILVRTGSNTPQIVVSAPNTDTETVIIRLRLYNFVFELRQLAPNWLTMANIPR